MRSSAPALLPILRSRTQAGILTATLLNRENEYTLTELASMLGASQAGVHSEVKRLEEASILVSRLVGRARLVRAGSGPLVSPLTRLVLLAFGPKQVVAEEFSGLPGLGEVLLFGSWAARYHDVPGAEPHDIDVLVVEAAGRKLDRADVYQAAERAERRLGRPVNPSVVSAARWLSNGQDDALLHEIFTRPVVRIPLPQADVNGEQDTADD